VSKFSTSESAGIFSNISFNYQINGNSVKCKKNPLVKCFLFSNSVDACKAFPLDKQLKRKPFTLVSSIKGVGLFYFLHTLL